MTRVSVGLKRFPDDLSYIESFDRNMDYIEMMALEGEDYSKLSKLDMPITLHHPHMSFNFNPCNKSFLELNKKQFSFTQKLADEFSADVIVVHPGDLDTPLCKEEYAIKFFQEHFDERIHFENLPDHYSLSSTPEKLRELMEKTKVQKICFDIGHAFLSYYSCKRPEKDFYDYVETFFEYTPSYFHFMGIDMSKKKDHLDFCENNFDFTKIEPFVIPNSRITLETPQITKKGEPNTKEQINDIKFIRSMFQ